MVLKTKGKTSLEHRAASTGITWRWIYVINKKEIIRVENILGQWNSHSKPKIHILLICILMSLLPMSDSEAFLRKDYSFPVTCVMCLQWNCKQMSLRLTLSKRIVLIMPEFIWLPDRVATYLYFNQLKCFIYTVITAGTCVHAFGLPY